MKITPIPILQDNYCWAIHTGVDITLVDPGEAAPVIRWLDANWLKPDTILITHHHGDHTGGVEGLKNLYGAKVIGPASENIPARDVGVKGDDRFTINAHGVRVLHTPGHTAGHVCYYFENDAAAFTGDTLFSLGCGRLFEGSADDMWQSLTRIAALPPETLIFCGHEYTLANGRFALNVDAANKDLKARMTQAQDLRDQGRPTLPVSLEAELKTNPFLRAKDVTDFAALRALKDNF